MEALTTPDRVPPAGLGPRKTPEETIADARKWIAYLLVGMYLFLLLVNVFLPVALYLMSGPHKSFSITDLKDLSTSISGILGGLVGILGFVVGYYFKAIDDDRNSKTRPKNKTK